HLDGAVAAHDPRACANIDALDAKDRHERRRDGATGRKLHLASGSVELQAVDGQLGAFRDVGLEEGLRSSGTGLFLVRHTETMRGGERGSVKRTLHLRMF